MKLVLLTCLLLLSIAGFCQQQDDVGLIQSRIRQICTFVSKDLLQKKKPNLWPLYVDLNYSTSPFLYDTIKNTIPGLPKYAHRADSSFQQIPFTDTSVAYHFDDHKRAVAGMTLFLAPPQGRFFVGELKPYPTTFAGGYVLVFEFDGEKMTNSYVGEWYN